MNQETKIPDTETLVCQDILRRQQLGIAKYGKTVAQNPLDLLQWLQHSYEEKLDEAVYIKRAMQELENILVGNTVKQINIDEITQKVMTMFNAQTKNS